MACLADCLSRQIPSAIGHKHDHDLRECCHDMKPLELSFTIQCFQCAKDSFWWTALLGRMGSNVRRQV